MNAGYTQKRAWRIKNGIDLDIVKIEDSARRMRRRVRDVSTGTASVEAPLEELREVARELKAIVDRRTQA